MTTKYYDDDDDKDDDDDSKDIDRKATGLDQHNKFARVSCAFVCRRCMNTT